ncbi:LysR family transcriptional regulator [Derxia gummosa]|uniref:LysR family transcriptional regulator n=1 Tax=Derxia gummosa DSM 723 TaxID=1121388 RepID=A0A8B6X6C7_9BURK|nr:LysR family transcriptional regulator [Derxia gummosa]
MKNVTFRQLRVFNEVARHLSFARAAEELHLTPPAVSMQVKELEENIGMPLFDRSGRTVALTTVGEYVLVYARKLLGTLRDAEDLLARLQRIDVGMLHIGMVSTASHFVPRLLADFTREHPGVEVRISVGNREQLMAMMSRNEVELAIMGRPPKEIAARAEPFAAHPHVFVAPPDHPSLNAGHPPLHALAPYNFIVRERGSGTRATMEQFFDEARFTPSVAMEVTGNEVIKQCVMAGIGLSVLSLHTLAMELQAGKLAVIDVEGAPIVRSWNLVHVQARTLSPVAEAFRYYVLENGEALLAHEFGALQPRRAAG